MRPLMRYMLFQNLLQQIFVDPLKCIGIPRSTIKFIHVNRTGYLQIWRCMQKLDPWVANGYADNFVADVRNYNNLAQEKM